MGFIIGMIIFIIVILLAKDFNKDGKKNKMKKEKKEIFIKENNIPSNTTQLQCIKHNEDSIYRNFYVWANDNYLNLYMVEGHSSTHIKNKIIIPVDDIVYYERYGEHRKETKVIAEKPNIKKAIIGGVIAGGAGAVIGAMDKKVVTETKEIDKRNTYLYYTIDNMKNTFVFDSKGFNELYRVLPKKAKNIVI